MRAMARSENETGESPGVHDRHFWLPEYAASMPHLSMYSGVPPRLVTQSMMVSAPNSCAILASASASDCAPVEVSACTKARIFASGLALKASRTLFGSTGAPQASSTITGTPPVRLTFSSMRPPNTPLRQTMTLSPGSTRLTKHISIPAEPGAETGKVSAFSVWNAIRSMDLICSIRSTKAGSRWPMVGRAMASRMRCGTSDGPGPMRMRLGGMKEAVINLGLCMEMIN